jgi:hypothetical protein
MHAPGVAAAWLAAGVMALAGLLAVRPSYAGFGLPPALRPVPATLGLEPARPERYAPETFAPQQYGNLDPAVCEMELARRAIPFARVDEARGVLAPIRLTGPLHGVAFTSTEPAAQRATSPLEILDCRLALALDDFAGQLATHGIVRVVHFSMYRPPPRNWPAARTASRHAGALAIDAAVFVKEDGSKLDVLHDFHGRIGASTCGPGTGPHPSTPEAVELRQIVCDAVDSRLFNIALTPDFNWPHRNHFHLEVKAGASTLYVH